MFIFEQSTCDILYKYIENDFEYSINCTNGMRVECENCIKISNGKNLFRNCSLELIFSNSYYKNIQKILIQHKKTSLKKNIHFSATINLHNEKILLNNAKYDDRAYGFLRIILKDCKDNIQMEDIDIEKSNQENLVYKINKSVDKNLEPFKFIGNKFNKKTFKSSVMLSPYASGYFIHEIVGHFLEEDYYCLSKKELKIPQNIMVIDVPSKICGINLYDDAGNLAKPITLIKDGKINNVLAVKKRNSFDKKIYGVARRTDFKSEILPRMRTTFIKNAKADINNKQSENQKYSVYVEKLYSGGVNPLSGEYFVFGNGFLVKNGEKTNYVRNLKISGDIFSDISKINFVGNDQIIFGAFCNKLDQLIRVGLGGSTIGISELSVEGDFYEHI